ncbi:hypothetical protein [Nocardioides insulae]|uniref:hypothetical protein n=1 Tax=Nocardioides insulae TaxID=394734 RepID=UPI00041CAFB5|nr:hypothetical protein [Nocardioides insulae]
MDPRPDPAAGLTHVSGANAASGGSGEEEVLAAAEGLRPPLPALLTRRLRRLVYDHATTERRRAHLPILHVGTPGARELLFPVRPEDHLDHALRADVIAALTRRSRAGTHDPGLLWLTRPGGLVLQDVDAAWLAAARQAYGEAGLPLVFVVANRHGWWDPRSGLSRTWVRMRRRSAGH